MKTIEVIVEHAGKNLSAYIEGAPIITVGNDIKEIENHVREAIALYLEDKSSFRDRQLLKERERIMQGNQAVIDYMNELLSGEFELRFKVDAATFINYYSKIFTQSALSRITGIDERQLVYYAAGVQKPQKRQLEKIQNGIRSLTKELSGIHLL